MASQAEEDPNVIDWDVDREILLFESMMGYKPVGINRHFMMACIHNKLSKTMDRQITSEPIWKHFDTMYNMAALHESEIVPFPNEDCHYKLCEDFGDLFYERLGVPLCQDEKSSATAKPDVEKMGPSKVKQATTPPSSGKVSENSGKVLSSTSTPSTKMNEAIKIEPNGETPEITLVKLASPIPGKSTKGKRLSMPNVKIKQEAKSNVRVKVQSISDLQAKKTELDTPSSKKVAEKQAGSVESAKNSKDASNSKKGGKRFTNTESFGNRRSSRIESIPLTKKSEGATSEKNSAAKSDKSESQNSTGASKMSRTPGKLDVEAKRRTRVKTEDTSAPKNTSAAKRSGRTKLLPK